MDTNDASDSYRQRLIENELLARKANKKVKKIIRDHTPYKEQDALVIDFYCECSAPQCEERVRMSLQEYEQLHQRNDRFVVATGHVSPTVEKLVDSKEDFVVVEKYALPA